MTQKGINDDQNRRDVLQATNSAPDKQATPQRRGLLKGLAATTVGLLGFSGSGSATPNPEWEADAKAAARPYRSENVVRGALAAQGADHLHALAKDGYIDSPAVSDLPLTLHRGPDAYWNADEGVLVIATVKDGDPAIKIQVKQQVDNNHRLVLIVHPNAGESSAMLVDNVTGETQTLGVDSTGSSLSTTATDCCYDWSDWYCGYGCSPYDNCTCVSYRSCEQIAENDCPCETGDSCGGCAGDEVC